ncbi:Cof-type HAD-IIB family hydrolase [Vagococcus fessus]|uniref:Haloacid dehalogenase n=1 Tax=Vagococcus fessus TaxID=120370 RepID=A0A430ACX5_9ENTE|nr:Cof-type HAD-IIB family hydrolase [Vagococcus fessus]RSU05075.1 hypothetical protein CBF31_03390 [Vagococcus fessus]
MYKLLVTDVDETLITSEGNISDKNIEYLNNLDDFGIKIIIASGRRFEDFQTILKKLNLDDKENNYSISFNGGVTTENKNNRIINQTNLNDAYVKQLFEIGRELDVLIHVFSLSHIYTYRMNQSEHDFLDDPEKLTLIDDLNHTPFTDDIILKVNFQSDDMSKLQAIEASLPEELKQQLDINYSSARYLEFNPLGVNKGRALKELSEELGIKPEEIIAIGDNMNDRTMIDFAGTGIAVANAVPELKEKADYICTNDHNNSAVAEAIEHFILKKARTA